MQIISVDKSKITELAKLFNDYRVFYKQESDFKRALDYLTTRIENNDAKAFIAYIDNEAVGFTLLYPFYSSVQCAPVTVLNDLFVSPSYRSKGVANALISKVIEHAKLDGCIRVQLETEVSNTPAQMLYNKLGFVKDQNHYFYSIDV